MWKPADDAQRVFFKENLIWTGSARLSHCLSAKSFFVCLPCSAWTDGWGEFLDGEGNQKNFVINWLSIMSRSRALVMPAW
jgi:hypothetical protein